MDSCPVVKVIDAPSGLVEYRIRNSAGKRIAFLQVASTCMDDELMEALHDFAERHEGPSLHVTPASVSIG